MSESFGGMSTDYSSSKLATPRRTTAIQAISSIFRTPTRLHTPTTTNRRSKRSRARTSSLSSTSSTPSTPSLPAVVLQTYSVSTDSVVLTALPSAPFCCHEDLLTMSRVQLEGVVRALNERLPRRMRIAPEDYFSQNDEQDRTVEYDGEDDGGLSRMSEAEMKRRIEELVGIRAVVGKNRVSRSGLGLETRAGVPQAPKAVRIRCAGWRPLDRTPWDLEMDNVQDQGEDLNSMIEEALMGSSPLAERTKSGQYERGRNNTLSRLPILQEENEGSECKEDQSEENKERASKRQRVSLASLTQRSEDGSQIVQEVRKSRLIENMDVSGSPLLAGEDYATSTGSVMADEEAAAVTGSSVVDARMAEGNVQACRRSARIRETALKRVSSVGTGIKTVSGARNSRSRSSILRSKTFSSGCSTIDNPTTMEVSDAKKDSKAPREFAIRLPFASTPPYQKPDSSVWSAPRILRSHSQRLSNPSQSTKTKASLGRSRSERYPRASDMAFVTIDRPRYRFTQRKSKGTGLANGDHELCVSLSTSPGHAASHSEIDLAFNASTAKPDDEKENQDSHGVFKTSTMGGLHSGTLPSLLYSFLSPRSRAPSTSTVASSRNNGGTSPARKAAKEGVESNANTITTLNETATAPVLEALGRMAVDSL